MLTRRLARKSETDAFGVCFVVNDQIISLRLAGKVSIDYLRQKQDFSFTLLLQLIVDRTNCVAHEGLILSDRFAALFELPLSLEQSSFVDECANVVQRDIINKPR